MFLIRPVTKMWNSTVITIIVRILRHYEFYTAQVK